MRYCTYRLDVGAIVDGEFIRDEITVDGQMYCPSDNVKHLNWKTLYHFGTDMGAAVDKLVELGREHYMNWVYTPGGYGITPTTLEKRKQYYCEWYLREYQLRDYDKEVAY